MTGCFAGFDLTLLSVRTDQERCFRFQRPDAPFFVLIGDKRGATVEVDWRDVDASAPRHR